MTRCKGLIAVVALLSMLTAASLACNMPTPQIAGPQPPPDAPTASADSLQSFNDKVRDLALATPGGPFSITFSEAEMTSALAESIREHEADTGESLPIQNPQIVLRDGLVYVYAQLQLDVTQATGLITAQPRIGADGLVDIEIVSAEFGPIDLDPGMLDDMVTQVEDALNAPIQAAPGTVTLTEIVISGGQMTFNGAITP